MSLAGKLLGRDEPRRITANVVSLESELIALRNDSPKIRKAKDHVDSHQQNDRAEKRYRNPIRFRSRRSFLVSPLPRRTIVLPLGEKTTLAVAAISTKPNLP
jgi:hypothetical protein